MMRRVTRASTGPNEVTVNLLGVHEWGCVGAEVLWLVGLAVLVSVRLGKHASTQESGY